MRTVDTLPLADPVAAAVVVDDQVELNARKYVLGLAGALQARGGLVFERSGAVSVSEHGTREVRTRAGAGAGAHAALEDYARAVYGAIEVTHRWSAHDLVTAACGPARRPSRWISPMRVKGDRPHTNRTVRFRIMRAVRRHIPRDGRW